MNGKTGIQYVTPGEVHNNKKQKAEQVAPGFNIFDGTFHSWLF